MTLTCSVCGVVYRHLQSLRRHLKSSHPSQIAPSPGVASCSLLCNVCSDENRFKSKLDFIKHLSAVHDVPDSTIRKDFDSLEEFRAWKIKLEEDSGAFYRASRTAKNKDTQVLTFECNRSGHYVPSGKGIRQMKIQGTRKIDGYCPSDLKVKIEKDGKCTVTHFEKHWGHGLDLQHLSLTANERTHIASKIAAKVPLKEILSEIRQNISNPDELKRFDLLTMKDIHNIKACLNLSSEHMMSQCDALSVVECVDEVETLQAQVCSGKMKGKNDELLKLKQETLALLENVTTEVENSTSVEEILAAKKILTSVLPAMAAIREGSGPNILISQKNSNKRNVEPQQRCLNFHSNKKSRT